ncbi:hypothetical protein KA089_00450 [Candidatus Woesebacteria bacterium]|nr:hypothetical protein [Candidatus Woesebacteria bacterium]
MKKEVKLLRTKAVNSLILSIEHFNRPFDLGRVEATLILIDHSFEMLLKASILHKGGSIRDKRATQTIGFDACLRKGLSEGDIKFLNEEDVVAIQTINTLRDAAQHHLLDISEQHLYLQAQLGLSLFNKIYKNVFIEDLYKVLPKRVLPLSTQPPIDISQLYKNEVEEISKLLLPGMRKGTEAITKIRSLAITEGAIQGEKVQPSNSTLRRIADKIKDSSNWKDIFPGVASINLTSKGYGQTFDLQFTKNKGIPINVVPEGTPNATVVGIRKINELDFYNLSLNRLKEKFKMTQPKMVALIRLYEIQSDSECYKLIKIGKSEYKRYSQKAFDKIEMIVAKKGFSQRKMWDEAREKGLI